MVWIAANYCTLCSSYVMFNVNWYKRNTNNQLIEMLNPMFYQYNRQWTIAIKHRKRIAEWEMLVKKPTKSIFSLLGLYTWSLLDTFPEPLVITLSVPLKDFAEISKWDGETLYECTFLIGRAPKDVCWNWLNPTQRFCANHPCDVPNKSDTYTQTEGTPSNKP